MSRIAIERHAFLRVAPALVDCVDMVVERLLSFLPSSTKQPLAEAVESPRAEDLEVQRAIDDVLEYHRTY